MERNWRSDPRPAMHWRSFNEQGRVECTLCPRHCKTNPGQKGFCGVRGNVEGAFQTFNYGYSVAATEECVETEAIFHYAPGGRILSLGNIGCMMACDYCQNWQTSQVKYLDDRVVHHYSPEQLVEIALENKIGIISWTYNDPVVWHEFVVATSKLAQQAGIRTLYKSAFYIEEKPADELIEVMDIFSLSLKSMSEDFYKKVARASLQPILDRIKQIHKSGRHLELSQLLVMGLNEKDEDVRRTIEWVLANVGDSVPLHFVGAHPAFKYTHVERTPVSYLKTAYGMAKKAGIKHCYLGNVFEDGVSDTFCGSCSNLQVKRFGLTSEVVGIDSGGNCSKCGTPSVIKEPHHAAKWKRDSRGTIEICASDRFQWTSDVKSVHLFAKEGTGAPKTDVRVTHLPSGKSTMYRLGGKGLSRVIISRADGNDTGIEVSWNEASQKIKILPVLDRAHFPVVSAMKDDGVQAYMDHLAAEQRV